MSDLRGVTVPEAVRIRMLGGFRVSEADRIIRESEWGLKKAAGLVKLLALAPGHRMHRERVIDLLWPKLGAKAAANNLHRTLHSARRTLGSAARGSLYLRLAGEELSLCPDSPLWVDVDAFEEAAITARNARDPAAYRAAIDLYAGELLPGDRYETWAEDRRESLRRTYLSLLVEVARIMEEREEYGAAIEALDRAVAEEPAYEAAQAGLVRLYALLGRRDEALEQYARPGESVWRGFGRAPDAASRHLNEEILAGRFPPHHPHQERRAVESGDLQHNLPAARSSFVGRVRDKLDVKRDLSMTRLLTLTGAGGCGKTRLALEVARDLVGAYPDGVWLAELAPLSDEALVPNAVAAALRVQEQPGRPLADTLAGFLRTRRMLLVLDNCEHLIAACARLVDRLLDSCENLRVLATSREALGVAGEATRPVPPLMVPDAGRPASVQDLTRYEAVGLFADRAGSRLPTFALTPENATAVADVCRRLDGIPLAIELAAARIGALSVGQISDRLEDSLGLLTSGGRAAPPRQRTLRATLAWSYELLNVPERRLFARLSVFAGGWTLEAAEAVGAGGAESEDVLDIVSKLVDKSLVVAEASGDDAPRYRMLEPVRQYARELLEKAEQVRGRHAEYYLTLAEAAEPELLGADQGRWLRRLRVELGNLRAALSWSSEARENPRERATLGLRLAAALWRFWDVQGFEEGKRWLRGALERDPGGSPAVRAKALGGLGWILLFQQEYKPATVVLEEAMSLYTAIGDRSGTAIALANFGYAVLHGGCVERVPAFVEEAEALIRGDLDHYPRALLRIITASAALAEGDVELGVARVEEGLALCREQGFLRETSMALFIRAMIEVSLGDLDRGEAMLGEGTRIAGDLGDSLGTAYCVWALGKVAFLRGSPLRAARLWGAAEATRERMGMSFSRFDLAQSEHERDLAIARSSVDERSWASAWAAGRAMTPEGAIEYALSIVEPASPVPRKSRTDSPAPPLSRREEEVALLAARGLTNRRIAEELSISTRTVDTHVYRVLRKLGFRSREQFVDWAGERRSC